MTEKILENKKHGMRALIIIIALYAAGIAAMIIGGIGMANAVDYVSTPFGVSAVNSVAKHNYTVLFIIGCIWVCIGWVPIIGLKILKPQEALVLTLFGNYIGTLKGEGFYFVNPFCVGVNPAAKTKLNQSGDVDGGIAGKGLSLNLSAPDVSAAAAQSASKKISLKVMTLNNSRQKINDCLGNPIEIGIAVMWRVVDTTGDGLADEGSLRGSSETVASRIRDEIQKKVSDAGIEIIEARITYLAYAPEIAAVMLQRQQASAIIDARKMIVDGAVGMVEMALERLEESGSVQLDEERKAAMVSNLLVVLCGNRDAQPIVNSGSLY